jgi:hypothetical protein
MQHPFLPFTCFHDKNTHTFLSLLVVMMVMTIKGKISADRLQVVGFATLMLNGNSAGFKWMKKLISSFSNALKKHRRFCAAHRILPPTPLESSSSSSS